MDKKVKRRSFIKKAIVGIVGAEAGFLVFDAFRSKTSKKKKTELFDAGKIEKFEKNKMYPFNSGKFYISVVEDGGMLALSIKCTHLGCIIQPDEKGFHCPCHASAFDKYGRVLAPPATRALDIFPITVSEGRVFVDISRPVKRKGYKKSQLTYI